MIAKTKRTGGLDFPDNSTFLPPPNRLVQDLPGKKRNCVKLFEYWKVCAGTVSEPTEKADLVEVRFYVHTPVVEPKLVDPLCKTRFHHLVTGPMWFEDPEDYFTEVSKRFGWGKWYVCINEANIHGHLMAARFESELNWDLYPPQIDLRMLVRTASENQDFIRWLNRTSARTPWSNPTDEDDEDEMASEATKTLADAVTNMAETAVRSVQEASEAKMEAVEARLEASEGNGRAPMVDAAAATESIKLVSATATAANEAAFRFADKMTDMVTKNSGSQFDPIRLMESAASLMRPQNNEDGSVKMLVEAMKDTNARMVEMQGKQLQFMETVVNKQQHAEGTGPLSGFDSMLENAEKMKRAAELFGWSRPSATTDREPAPPAAPPGKSLLDSISENIVPVCTMITTVFALGANIIHNMRSKPGEAENPAAALQKAQANNPALQYQQQTQQPGPQPVQQDPRTVWKQMMDYIAPTLETHIFQADLNGFTFAEWVMCEGTGALNPTPEGRRKYVAIREQLGRPQFEQLIKEHNGLWSKLQGMPAMVSQFLDEFFGFDEWQASQQQEGAAA